MVLRGDQRQCVTGLIVTLEELIFSAGANMYSLDIMEKKLRQVQFSFEKLNLITLIRPHLKNTSINHFNKL